MNPHLKDQKTILGGPQCNPITDDWLPVAASDELLRLRWWLRKEAFRYLRGAIRLCLRKRVELDIQDGITAYDSPRTRELYDESLRLVNALWERTRKGLNKCPPRPRLPGPHPLGGARNTTEVMIHCLRIEIAFAKLPSATPADLWATAEYVRTHMQTPLTKKQWYDLRKCNPWICLHPNMPNQRSQVLWRDAHLLIHYPNCYSKSKRRIMRTRPDPDGGDGVKAADLAVQAKLKLCEDIQTALSQNDPDAITAAIKAMGGAPC